VAIIVAFVIFTLSTAGDCRVVSTPTPDQTSAKRMDLGEASPRMVSNKVKSGTWFAIPTPSPSSFGPGVSNELAQAGRDRLDRSPFHPVKPGQKSITLHGSFQGHISSPLSFWSALYVRGKTLDKKGKQARLSSVLAVQGKFTVKMVLSIAD
jgi:hypothetical protein